MSTAPFLAAFSALLFFGCARGELRVATDEEGAADAPASGGAAGAPGSGGVASTPDPEAGGSGSSCGDGCEPSPCTGLACFDDAARACLDGSGDCPLCGEFVVCPHYVPFCGPRGECRQCIDSVDCLASFGGELPVCWSGFCTSCQSDEDCPFGLACTQGRCGNCDENHACPDGLSCRQGTCRPQ